MKYIILGPILLIACNTTLIFAAPSTPTANDPSTASSSTNYIPQKSPYFPDGMTTPTDVVTSYNSGPYNLSDTLPTYKLTTGYPDAWKIPDPSHPEVQAIIAQIDWSLVPDAPVRNKKRRKRGGNVDGDPYCWWTDTECVRPKINIPKDMYECPNKGEWGLTYDDGPFNLYSGKNAALENPYAEPALYNFLAKTNNQKASLFYIGTNVANYPAAAKRAFNDGHYICVHTWSHPPMTSVTNQQAVAELYWTLKVIKETTGVTPKCWRPPQGDVDDRIRSIAWQMGLHTILWDRDTQDWAMPAPGGGNLSPSKVDGFFEKWIAEEKNGNQTHGHIVLEHELNSMTVGMTEKWLPIIQKDFNVVSALACNGVTQPYWETNMVYPLADQPVGGDATSSSQHNFYTGGDTSNISSAIDLSSSDDTSFSLTGSSNGDDSLNVSTNGADSSSADAFRNDVSSINTSLTEKPSSSDTSYSAANKSLVGILPTEADDANFSQVTVSCC